jgi:hypothetical protein
MPVHRYYFLFQRIGTVAEWLEVIKRTLTGLCENGVFETAFPKQPLLGRVIRKPRYPKPRYPEKTYPKLRIENMTSVNN